VPLALCDAVPDKSTSPPIVVEVGLRPTAGLAKRQAGLDDLRQIRSHRSGKARARGEPNQCCNDRSKESQDNAPIRRHSFGGIATVKRSASRFQAALNQKISRRSISIYPVPLRTIEACDRDSLRLDTPYSSSSRLQVAHRARLP